MDQIHQESECRAVDHSEEDPNNEYIIDHGLDARRRRGGRDRQAIDEARQLMRRFGPEVGTCPDRDRNVSDAAAPSRASVSRTHSRYPGLSRIGDASHDGELPPHADKIGGF
jgi:hypothetical protein